MGSVEKLSNFCSVYIQKAAMSRQIWFLVNILLITALLIGFSTLLIKKFFRPSYVIVNIQDIVLSLLLLSTFVLLLFLGYSSFANRESFYVINMLTNNRLPYSKFNLTLNKIRVLKSDHFYSLLIYRLYDRLHTISFVTQIDGPIIREVSLLMVS